MLSIESWITFEHIICLMLIKFITIKILEVTPKILIRPGKAHSKLFDWMGNNNKACRAASFISILALHYYLPLFQSNTKEVQSKPMQAYMQYSNLIFHTNITKDFLFSYINMHDSYMAW